MTKEKKNNSNNEGILPTASRFTQQEKAVFAAPTPRIPGYRIIRELGEGGMGIIYLAEQTEPIKRRVAIKVIKPGMDSQQVIARFEAEQQALALLDHPGIAKVYSAGITETGRSYFVMEYVKGIALTDHCEHYRLSIEERLKLFIQVCDAIQHAHQKGIIHRDIKPSNILVSIENEKPILKIIDFGIAKAISTQLTEHTLYTQQGQMIGTPDYMSPEQAELTNQDIDTRSDIYSLGVVLYELLTGAPPFDSKKLREAPLGELQKIIEETDPPRPSVRLSNLGEQAKEIARKRKTDIPSLTKRLHKELEWIPLKAMRKERTHRYRSASELADDIKNYLKGAPLIAGPESVSYQVRKFINRNRMLVTSVVTILIVLVAGILTSTILAIKESKAKAIADSARKAETLQKQIAETERDRAIKAEQETQLVNERLIWENYVMTIGKIQQLVDDGDITSARELLLTCPKKHRHLEWGHLLYRCHQDVKSVKVGQNAVHSIVFSPDRTKIATGDGGAIVKVWDKEMNQVLFETNGKFVVFSPDSRYLATWYRWMPNETEKRELRVWDVETGQKVRTFRAPNPIETACIHPTGELIVCGGSDGMIKAWDLQTGEEAYSLSDAHDNGKITSVTFSPNGMYLATAADDKRVALWDAQTGQKRSEHKRHGNNKPNAIAFTPDSRQLVSVDGGTGMIFWDINTNKTQIRHTGRWNVTSLAINPNGQYFALKSGDNTTTVHNLRTWEQIKFLQGTGTLADSALAFTPDNRYLLTGGTLDGEVRFWFLNNGFDDELLFFGHKVPITSLVFSPDGKLLATCTGMWGWVEGIPDTDNTVRIWEVATGDLVHVLKGHECPVTSVAFSPDNSLLITGSSDHVAKAWSIQSGQEIMTFAGHTDQVESVAVDPRGETLATGSSDTMIKLWDLSTGELLRTLSGHTGGINVVIYSDDGRFLASACTHGKIIIWNAQTGEEITHITTSQDWPGVVCLAFDPSGEILASAGTNVKMWDTKSGQLIAELTHTSSVWWLGFTQDGKRLITKDLKPIKVWDVQTKQLVLSINPPDDCAGPLTLSRDSRSIAIRRHYNFETGVRILHTFSWKDEDYPGDSNMSLSERIELYKRNYWKKCLSSNIAEESPSADKEETSCVKMSIDPRTDYLVSLWKLDEGKGDNAYDSSGNKHHGRLGFLTGPDSNDPMWQNDSERGWCLYFDGGDYINCGGGKSIGESNTWADLDGSFTLSAWIKYTDWRDWGCFISKGELAWKLQLFGQNWWPPETIHFAFSRKPKGGIASKTSLESYRWHHVAATWDDDEGKACVYIDGEVGDCHYWKISSPYGTFIDNDCNVLIGAKANEDWIGGNINWDKKAGCPCDPDTAEGSTAIHFFKGYISDVRIYRRALTANEIHNLARDNLNSK